MRENVCRWLRLMGRTLFAYYIGGAELSVSFSTAHVVTAYLKRRGREQRCGGLRGLGGY